MTAIVDYGVGNLFSLKSSLECIGEDAVVTKDADVLLSSQRVILPGVGAFEDAMAKLKEQNLCDVLANVVKKEIPLLGICLGMQLLFSESHEFGRHKGLGFLGGEVVSLEDALKAENFTHKVPHMGWNPLDIKKENCPILKYTKQKDAVYYVHSFYAQNCDESLVATSEYGINVTGVVQKDKVYGTQFHPEKSGDVGLLILKAFTEVK